MFEIRIEKNQDWWKELLESGLILCCTGNPERLGELPTEWSQPEDRGSTKSATTLSPRNLSRNLLSCLSLEPKIPFRITEQQPLHSLSSLSYGCSFQNRLCVSQLSARFSRVPATELLGLSRQGESDGSGVTLGDGNLWHHHQEVDPCAHLTSKDCPVEDKR